MQLTQEQQTKLLQVLRVSQICPNCGSRATQSVHPDEYQLVSNNRTPDSLVIGGPFSFMPLVAVICPDCGHVRLFNLSILGVVNS